MTTPPAWLTDLLANHRMRTDFRNDNIGCVCGERVFSSFAMERHVAAVVWSEIERRVKAVDPVELALAGQYAGADILDALGGDGE